MYTTNTHGLMHLLHKWARMPKASAISNQHHPELAADEAIYLPVRRIYQFMITRVE